jgi:hypothetical protein
MSRLDRNKKRRSVKVDGNDGIVDLKLQRVFGSREKSLQLCPRKMKMMRVKKT